MWAVSLLDDAARNGPLYLSTWVGGRVKVTALASSSWEHVRWAMGCVGDATTTLGSGATTPGVDAWDVGSDGLSTLGSGAVVPVCKTTLGVDARDVGSGCACGETTLGGDAWDVGSDWCAREGLKMARRLSTARSCSWQLSGVRSARMATVSARRQWMTLSVVESVGTDMVLCWKVTVSDTTTAEVDALTTL